MTDRGNWTPPLYEFRVGDRVKLRPGMIPFAPTHNRRFVGGAFEYLARSKPDWVWNLKRGAVIERAMDASKAAPVYGGDGSVGVVAGTMHGHLDPACLMLADPDEHRARLGGRDG